MNRNPEVLAEEANLSTYVLEWIVRCHPDFLLPLSCKTEGSMVRISFQTEGLLTLSEYAGNSIKDLARPAEWIAGVLESIREILVQADDYLLDRSLLQLDIHSVWYRPKDPVPDIRAAPEDLLQLVLTCVPIAGAVQAGDLASIAMGLLEIAEKSPQSDTSDTALRCLKLAASHGVDALCDHLDVLAGQKTSPGDPQGKQAIPAGSIPDKQHPSFRTQKTIVLTAWIVFTLVLASIPLAMRYGPEPFRMFRSGASTGYRRIVSAVLGAMALSDSLLLFAPFSPFRLSGRKMSVHPAHKSSCKVKLRSIRQEIRVSGLLTVFASRLGKSGRLGAPTSQVAVMSGSERLGFLSEGEPGTLSESQGIRAYLLTAEFLVGRDPDMADLAVPDASIGRLHARISRIEGVFFLTDLGSVNGTRLDGRRLDRHVQTALPDKCRISFAERTFYFIAD